jgi:hypothetical protein
MLMELDILTGGSEYISATRASERTGYSSDYIGQLCRAKKVPGKLIGRTWYVELETLLAHKRMRKLGRARGTRLSKFRDVPSSYLAEAAAMPQSLAGVAFKYESDDRPLLPTLTKNVITEDDGPRELSVSLRMSVATLSLVLMIGIGYFGSVRMSHMASNTQAASVSLFGAAEDLMDFIIGGFQDLKSFAVSGFMDSAVAPVRTNTTVAAAPAQPIETPVREAVAVSAPVINVPVATTNLKAELLAYLDRRLADIDAPVTIYQSGPTFNTTVLRSDILVDDTRPAISRQSDSDSSRTTTLISRVTNDGTFANPTITGGTISGASGAFTELTAINATTSTFAVTGDGSGLVFYGSGNHDIFAAGGTLRIGSNTIIGNVEALDDTVDIGTPMVRFDKIYANEVNASTLVGTLTGGNLIAETFSINSDNATADGEDSYLAFERGSVSPNAILKWDSTGDEFELNAGLNITNAIGSTYGLLVATGRVGIGTGTPAVSLDIFGTDAMRIPVGTTIQRPTGGIGMVRFNTTTHTFEGYSDSGVWQGLGGVIDTDQDTYITADTGGADEDAIRFYTAGTEKVAILSSGNVGIGSTNPSAKLEVVGSGVVQGVFQQSGTVGGIQLGNSNVQLYRPSAQNVALTGDNLSLQNPSAQTKFYFDMSSGNAGIGTTTPTAKLSITRANSVTQNEVVNQAINIEGTYDGSGGAYLPGITWSTSNNGASKTKAGIWGYVDDVSSQLRFGTTYNYATGVNTNAFVLTTNSGSDPYVRAGLGTSTPNNVLDIYNTQKSAIGFSGASGPNYKWTIGMDVASGGRFSISSSTALGTTDRLVIDGNGKVGIGTTNPGFKLDVVGDIRGETFASAATSGTATRLTFKTPVGGSNLSWLFQTRDNVSGAWYMDIKNEDDPGLTIKQSGLVGINQTAPTAFLEVRGSGIEGEGLVWGHANANYASSLGANSIDGLPFLAFFGRAGSGNNIKRNLGGFGVGAISADTSGNLFIRNAPSGTADINVSNFVDTLTLTNAGKIGIGTTSPLAMLAINDPAGTTSFSIGSSTPKFIVKDNGNIGIGTSSPAALLTVVKDSATILSSGYSGNWAAQIINRMDDVNEKGLLVATRYSNPTGTIFQVQSDRGRGFTVDGAGTANAYLGFNIPALSASTFNMNVDSQTQTDAIITNKYSNPTNPGVTIGTLSTSAGYAFRVTNGVTYSAAGIATSGGTDIFTVRATGLVGIGTTTPNNKLDIYSATKSAIGFSGAGDSTYKWTIGMDVTNGGRFSIASSSALGTTDRFVIDGNGNVGIGTTNPTSPLHVSPGAIDLVGLFEGTGGVQARLGVNTINASADSILTFFDAGVSKWSVGNRGDDDTNSFMVSTGSTLTSPQFTILDTGRVGIGTTSPWVTLAVAGRVALPNLSNNATGYYACVNTAGGGAELATSTTACGASSIKYKENVTDLAYGLDELLRLRPVSFDWKHDFIPDGTHQIGFIAEEVEGVVPEIIGYNSNGEVMNMDYAKLTSVLTNAIKEIATITGKFKDNLIAWFADTANGITEMIAGTFRAKDKLCINDTCVTEQQLQALLLNAGQSNSSGNVITTPPSDDQEEGNATSTDLMTDQNNATSTEPSIDDTDNSSSDETEEIADEGDLTADSSPDSSESSTESDASETTVVEG